MLSLADLNPSQTILWQQTIATAWIIFLAQGVVVTWLWPDRESSSGINKSKYSNIFCSKFNKS